MDRYILIYWPESQRLMEEPGFEDNSHLAYIEGEDGAYFINEEWYKFVRELPVCPC